jgi:hypothetical protein
VGKLWQQQYQQVGPRGERAGPRPTPDFQERRRRRERKRSSLSCPSGLSSYLYRLFVTCVHLSMLGVVSTTLFYVGILIYPGTFDLALLLSSFVSPSPLPFRPLTLDCPPTLTNPLSSKPLNFAISSVPSNIRIVDSITFQGCK